MVVVGVVVVVVLVVVVVSVVVVVVLVQMKQTALHVAVETGNSDIISLLLAAGTQLTLRDSVGRSVHS